MEEASDVLFSIGPLEITGTVTTMWAIIAVIALFCFLATRKLTEVPGTAQNLAEMAVEKLQSYFASNLGYHHMRKYFPIFATFFIFIIVSNYSGILPGAGHLSAFKVPTACLSVTAGLGIIAALTTHTIGVKEKGFGKYLMSFLKPTLIMLPLNLIEQVVRPFSLALRLYGNMFGEEMVTEKLYEIFAIAAPLIMQVMSLIFCFIQAMVFTMLLSIYTSEAVE